MEDVANSTEVVCTDCAVETAVPLAETFSHENITGNIIPGVVLILLATRLLFSEKLLQKLYSLRSKLYSKYFPNVREILIFQSLHTSFLFLSHCIKFDNCDQICHYTSPPTTKTDKERIHFAEDYAN